MNRAETTRTATEPTALDREFDRILADEDDLIPSSGFLASVMERVHQEAAQPAPLPFPWKRLLSGFVLAVGVIACAGYEFLRQGLSLTGFFTTVTRFPMQLPPTAVTFANQAEWVALALGASLLSWLFARRLAGRGGLL